LQSSLALHIPLPQHEPHCWSASLTHWPSQFMSQQNGSDPQTVAAQGSQAGSSAVPVSQAE